MLYQFKKLCQKFLNDGRFRGGCTKWHCPHLHIQLFQKSYLWRECLNPYCQARHLPGTQRTKRTEPTQIPAAEPPSNCQVESCTQHSPATKQRATHVAWPAPSVSIPLATKASTDLFQPQGNAAAEPFLLIASVLAEMQKILKQISEQTSHPRT